MILLFFMNKQDLVHSLAEKTGLTKAELEHTLECLVETIQERVAKGEDVTLMGFGTFTLTKRKARQGYDPHRKKKIDIPEIILPKFRVGKEFKAALNPKRAKA